MSQPSGKPEPLQVGRHSGEQPTSPDPVTALPEFDDSAEVQSSVPARPSPSPASGPLAPTEQVNRVRFLTFLRLFGGVMTLLTLAYFMWTPGEWPTRLLVWVLLVIVADEFGGWFGYLGLLLGGLGYLSPNPVPVQWLVILPLVGGALTALLLVKHSGGLFVLPFAGLLFAGTLLAVGRFGAKFDPELKLPMDETFQRMALLAMLIGLGISLLRQTTGLILNRRVRHA